MIYAKYVLTFPQTTVDEDFQTNLKNVLCVVRKTMSAIFQITIPITTVDADCPFTLKNVTCAIRGLIPKKICIDSSFYYSRFRFSLAVANSYSYYQRNVVYKKLLLTVPLTTVDSDFPFNLKKY